MRVSQFIFWMVMTVIITAVLMTFGMVFDAWVEQKVVDIFLN